MVGSPVSSVKAAYEEGIELAICDSGYEPKRIDRDQTVDKIDDAIILEIRRSRFVVADFTHGSAGARGGVYYEAGFAHGLGIPVIFTCRKDMIDELHFDTRQYAHIVWDKASDLRTSLRDRILARIGDSVSSPRSSGPRDGFPSELHVLGLVRKPAISAVLAEIRLP